MNPDLTISLISILLISIAPRLDDYGGLLKLKGNGFQVFPDFTALPIIYADLFHAFVRHGLGHFVEGAK